uniref:Uncharacterized protein n=1 Tax=Arundo donax TaxID=35708 RepID=A0A0A9HC57_ARUDO
MIVLDDRPCDCPTKNCSAVDLLNSTFLFRFAYFSSIKRREDFQLYNLIFLFSLS